MSEMDTTIPESEKRRWTRFILPVSLAINLLFVGVFVGGGLMRHKYGSGFGGPPGMAVKHLLRHLPDDKRQSILDQISGHRMGQRSRKNALRIHNERFQKALKAEPFDANQVRLMAKNLHKARGELVDEKMELLVNVLAQLTPTERRKLLDSRFFRHLFKRGEHRYPRYDRRN